MGFRIKPGLNTAVSIALVVSETPDGEPVEQELIYLPGAALPENLSPRLVALWEGGDAHLHSLIEATDVELPRYVPDHSSPVSPVAPVLENNPFAAVEEQQEAAPAPEPEPVSTAAVVEELVAASSDNQADAAPAAEKVDYSELRKAELEAEIARRQASGRVISVVGTGANGAVTNEDRITALTNDDAAAAGE